MGFRDIGAPRHSTQPPEEDQIPAAPPVTHSSVIFLFLGGGRRGDHRMEFGFATYPRATPRAEAPKYFPLSSGCQWRQDTLQPGFLFSPGDRRLLPLLPFAPALQDPLSHLCPETAGPIPGLRALCSLLCWGVSSADLLPECMSPARALSSFTYTLGSGESIHSAPSKLAALLFSDLVH